MTIEAIKASIDAFTSKTTETVTAVSAKVDAANAEIERIGAVLKRPGLGGTAANDNTDLKAELNAIAVFARTGADAGLKEIHAGMSVSSDPDGGYLVMPTYSTTMTKKLYDAVPMRRLARVETISSDTFIEPIDNGETEAVWVGEKTARPPTESPKIGELSVTAHEIYSSTPITQRLMDDAGFDMGAYVDGKTTDKFSRSEGAAFVNGNGVKQPRGILNIPTSATSDATRPWTEVQHVVSGAAAAINADSLRNLFWTLRAPYRAGATFVMNSNTANLIDRLKTGDGEYMWRSGMTSGAPNTLLGFPVEFEEGFPDVAAGSLSIAFGNFKLAYCIVDRLGVRFQRDTFTSKPNVLFDAWKRVGGGHANTQAIKFLKTAA